jgi:hypothetical protein
MMADAPNRIWANKSINSECVVSFASPSEQYCIEYIRADLSADLRALEALRVMLDTCISHDEDSTKAFLQAETALAAWNPRADLSRDLVRAALERAAQEAELGARNDIYTKARRDAARCIRAMAKDDEAVAAIITSVLGETT